jgi:hypothetical protein
MLRSLWGSLSGAGRPSEGTTHWVHGGIAVRGQSKAGAPGISRTATGTTCNRALYKVILRRGRRGVGRGWRTHGWSLGQRPGWGDLGRRSRSVERPINFFGAIAGLTGGPSSPRIAVPVSPGKNCAANQLGNLWRAGVGQWVGSGSSESTRSLAPGLASQTT